VLLRSADVGRGRVGRIRLPRGDPANRRPCQGHNATRDPSGMLEHAAHESIPVTSLDAR